MSRTPKFVATGLATAMSLAALAAPAAAVDGTQTVTFSVAGGALAVTAVAPAAPLTVSGTTASGTLGLVTVTDLRVPGGNWTVGVKSTDFTATLPNAQTIAASKGSIWVPGGTVTGTLITATTTYNENAKLGLTTTSQNFVTTTGGQTGNSALFTPSMSVDLTGANPGVYTGTVTYTVL